MWETMTIVAIQTKKSAQTAILTCILSRFFSSAVYPLTDFNQSTEVVERHSYKGVTFSNILTSFGNTEDAHISHANISCYWTSIDSRLTKIGSSYGANNAGFSRSGFIFYSPSCRHLLPRFHTILRQACNPATLAEELESALEDQRFEDAWKNYEHYKQVEGFPRKSLLNRLVRVWTNSGDTKWLDKAYLLVLQVIEAKKQELLDNDSLTPLCLILARADMPVPASTILRTMVDINEYPPVDMWSIVIAQMAKTENGAYLASEIVIEMCYFFKDGRLDPRKRKNAPLLAMKPNTESFNIALNASLRFGMTKKAEQLLELMPRVGVKPDASSLAIMIQIYEKNNHRDELIKLKRHIDETPGILDHQYQQFYSSLLMSHLNFGDLDAASQIILQMLNRAKAARSSLAAAKSVLSAIEKNPQRPLMKMQNVGQFQNENLEESAAVHVMFEKPPKESAECLESNKIQNSSVISAEAEKLPMQLKVRSSGELLVNVENRILIPNEKAYAKLVKGYLESDRVNDLAAFLIRLHKEGGSVSVENSPSAQVIDVCVVLGWLDKAHDILDEITAAEVPVGAGVYSSLLKAYCKARQPTEAALLLKKVKQAGLQLDASCYDAVIELRMSQKDMHGALDLFKEMKEAKISSSSSYQSLMNGLSKQSKPNLMASLLEEVKDRQLIPVGVHEWNSVIDFFCKKQLMHDAMKAFKKMKDLGYQPNLQTFYSLVCGFSAAEYKQDVAMLWEELKKMVSKASKTEVKPLEYDQELLDTILCNFVRGANFESALEVISIMQENNMFIDKVKYRKVFLKYHGDLCKNKKASKVQSEAQNTRREFAIAYRRWAGLD